MILVPQRPAMPQSTSPTKPAPTSGKSPRTATPTLSPVRESAHPQNAAPLFQGAFLSRPMPDQSGETSLGFLERLAKRHLAQLASLLSGMQKTLMITLGMQPALQKHQEPDVPNIRPNAQETEPPLEEGPDGIDLMALGKPVAGATPLFDNAAETQPATEVKSADRPPISVQDGSSAVSSDNTQVTGEEQPDTADEDKLGTLPTAEPHKPDELSPPAMTHPALSPDWLNPCFEEDQADSVHQSLSSSLASSIELVERPVSPKLKDVQDLEAGWALVEDNPPPNTEASHISQTYPPQKSRHGKPHKLPLSQRFNQFILKRGDAAKL